VKALGVVVGALAYLAVVFAVPVGVVCIIVHFARKLW
jgi:hypothetical protein